jgi:hypothetical protein
MFDAEKFPELFFELLHVRTVVREPSTIPDIARASQEALAVAYAGPSDVERFGKCRLSTKQCQVGQFRFWPR